MADTFSIVLAGGPMHRATDTPRPLIRVAGVPLLGHALELVETFVPKRVVVVAGEGFHRIKDWVGGRAGVVEQQDQLGSGHAVGLALQALPNGEGGVFVTYTDRVFLTTASVQTLLAAREPRTVAALLSVHVDNPAGYARIIRDDDGKVIRGAGDCEFRAPGEAKIREVVAGAFWFDLPALRQALPAPSTLGRKYNLTECLEAMIATGGSVVAVPLSNPAEARGIYSEEDARRAQPAL